MENAHLGVPWKVNVCNFFHKNLKKERFAWSKTIVEIVRVSIAARKHYDQSKIWRGNHLCHLKHPLNIISLKEFRTWSWTGQELGRMQENSLFIIARSAGFPMSPRMSSEGGLIIPWSWVSHIIHQSKIQPSGLLLDQYDEGIFLTNVSYSNILSVLSSW